MKYLKLNTCVINNDGSWTRQTADIDAVIRNTSDAYTINQ